MSKYFRLSLSFGFALSFAVPAAATCGIDRYTAKASLIYCPNEVMLSHHSRGI